MDRGGAGAEGEFAGEGHHVHRGTEAGLASAGQAEFADQVLAAEPLVADDVRQGAGDVRGQFGEAAVRVRLHPDGQDVDHRAGRGQSGPSGAAREGQREGEVGPARHAVVEDGGGGDGQGRPLDAQAVREGGEPGDQILREWMDAAQAAVGAPGDAVGQGDGVGDVGEQVEPVGPVVRPAPGVGVGGLLGGHPVQGREGGGGRLLAGEQGGVERGDPGRVDGLAEAVEDGVVIAVHVEGAVVGEQQQRLGAERAAREVEGLGHLACRPAVRLGLRVGGVPQVDDVQRPGFGGGDHLPQPRLAAGTAVLRAGVLGEVRPQRLGLLDAPVDRPREDVDVDGTVDLVVAAAVVEGAVRLQLLGDPDAQLGRGGGSAEGTGVVGHGRAVLSGLRGYGLRAGRGRPGGAGAGRREGRAGQASWASSWSRASLRASIVGLSHMTVGSREMSRWSSSSAATAST
ncbi:hypothetical protein SGLAM104S_01057 [Streptomyces glaucescens]